MLDLIPTLYMEKIDYENKFNKTVNLDEFLVIYFTDKYKLKNVIEENIEKFLKAVQIHKNADPRVQLFRRFLNLGQEPISKEIFNTYMIICNGKIIFQLFITI